MTEADFVSTNRPIGARAFGAAFGPRQIGIDCTDLRILSILQRQGRITKAKLAEEVELSPSACFDRMKLLEQKKLLSCYRAFVNIAAIHPFEVFFTEVTLKSHRAADFFRFESFVKSDIRAVECFALGGGIDYLLKFVAKDVAEYQATMDDLLEAEIGIEKYFTYIVTKPVKTASYIPMEAVISG